MKTKTKIIIVALLLFIPISNGYTAISMAERLKGRILLQVEENGEAWFVDERGERTYLKDGQTAYELMRFKGLGITNFDLNEIPISQDSEIPFIKEENEDVISYVTDKYGEQVELINGISYSGKTAQEITDERIQYLLDEEKKKEVITYVTDKYGTQIKLVNGVSSSGQTAQQIIDERIQYLIDEATENGVGGGVIDENINDYINTVVAIMCVDYYGDYTYGSGSLVKFSNSQENWVLTNKHVISGADYCYIYKDDVSLIKLELVNYTWNSYGDVASMKIDGGDDLDYSLTYMPKCDAKEPIGSTVYALGFPSYSRDSGGYSHIIVTTGIISGYREADTRLPYDNYLVDLKLESGNSGGMAFLRKDDGNFCKLGIPTAVRVGTYENLGVIQNLHNVYYKD